MSGNYEDVRITVAIEKATNAIASTIMGAVGYATVTVVPSIVNGRYDVAIVCAFEDVPVIARALREAETT